MSADILRRAASLMRERAEAARAATPDLLRPDGEWIAKPHRMRDNCTTIQTRGETFVAHYVIDGTADHIASWHPAVALAVADLLDAESDASGGIEHYMQPKILNVARAYLGETS